MVVDLEYTLKVQSVWEILNGEGRRVLEGPRSRFKGT